MKYEIIYKNLYPYGIRNADGYILFFTKIQKYEGQNKRFCSETEKQHQEAALILKALNKKETKTTKNILCIDPDKEYWFKVLK